MDRNRPTETEIEIAISPLVEQTLSKLFEPQERLATLSIRRIRSALALFVTTQNGQPIR